MHMSMTDNVENVFPSMDNIILPFFILGYNVHITMETWIMDIAKTNNADNESSSIDIDKLFCAQWRPG